MTNELTHADPSYGEIMERVLIAGDLSRLTPAERTSFYMQTCNSLGLNPLTQPFEYIKLNGKEQLYARKACTDQLRALRRLSVSVKDQSIDGDMLTVTVGVRDASGREDEDFGSVSVRGLSGEALANARMKAITKAKRRATLSFCGLGVLDETEIEDAQSFTPRDITPEKPKRITSDPLAIGQASAPSPQQTPASPEMDPPSRGASQGGGGSGPPMPSGGFNGDPNGGNGVDRAMPLDLPFVMMTGEIKSCTSRPTFLSMMEAAFEGGEPEAALECFFANQAILNDFQSVAFDRHEKAKTDKARTDARAVLDRVNAVFETAKELQKVMKG